MSPNSGTKLGFAAPEVVLRFLLLNDPVNVRPPIGSLWWNAEEDKCCYWFSTTTTTTTSCKTKFGKLRLARAFVVCGTTQHCFRRTSFPCLSKKEPLYYSCGKTSSDVLGEPIRMSSLTRPAPPPSCSCVANAVCSSSRLVSPSIRVVVVVVVVVKDERIYSSRQPQHIPNDSHHKVL